MSISKKFVPPAPFCHVRDDEGVGRDYPPTISDNSEWKNEFDEIIGGKRSALALLALAAVVAVAVGCFITEVIFPVIHAW